MPQPARYYGENHVRYLTTSTYRRVGVFDSARFKHYFVQRLAELRTEAGGHGTGFEP